MSDIQARVSQVSVSQSSLRDAGYILYSSERRLCSTTLVVINSHLGRNCRFRNRIGTPLVFDHNNHTITGASAPSHLLMLWVHHLSARSRTFFVTMCYRLRLDTCAANIYILGYSVFCGLHYIGDSRGCRGAVCFSLGATDRGSRLAGVSLESRST